MGTSQAWLGMQLSPHNASSLHACPKAVLTTMALESRSSYDAEVHGARGMKSLHSPKSPEGGKGAETRRFRSLPANGRNVFISDNGMGGKGTS
jgi:hypothetical protein